MAQSRRRACRVPREPGCECEFCHYCDGWLPASHEHDHFPVPSCAGGTATVPACANCQNLKDRTMLDGWPVGMALAGLLDLADASRVAGWLALDPEQVQQAGGRVLADLGDVSARWAQLSPAARLLYAKLRKAYEFSQRHVAS